jgi:hypothetical protein
MDVYCVRPEGSPGCYFDSLDEALEELRTHLQEGIDKVVIVRKEMTKEDFDTLPEFEGY